MKVRAVRAASAPIDGVVRALRPGRVYDLQDPYLSALLGSGAVADPDAAPAPAPEPAPAPAEQVKSAEEPEAEESPKPPRKTAKLEDWQDFARAQGIDPKGLSKQELIAAIG